MEITFVIDSSLDDAGVEEFYARRSIDFDNNGIPFSNVFVGTGENPHEAIYNLLDLLEEFGVPYE